MKTPKFITAVIVVLVLILPNIAKAQQWSTISTNNDIWNLNTRYVGINTTSPGATLDVNGSVNIGSTGNKLKLIEWNPGKGYWIDIPVVSGIPTGIGSGGQGYNAWIAYTGVAGQWFPNSTAGDLCYRNASGKLLFGNSGSVPAAMAISGNNVGIGCDPGSTPFKVYKTVNPNIQLSSNYSRLEFGVSTSNGCFANGAIAGDGVIRTLGGSHNTILSMPDTGGGGNCYIGIGDDSSTDPSTSLWAKFCNNKVLRVNGTIIATEMDVQSDVWADNVFEPDYELKSLAEIETYIKANKHLPEIPTTTEVKENGINVAKINVLLLKKIEELTLLMIEQNKTIGELQNKVSKLEK